MISLGLVLVYMYVLYVAVTMGFFRNPFISHAFTISGIYTTIVGIAAWEMSVRALDRLKKEYDTRLTDLERKYEALRSKLSNSH